ncbi:von Willebrand factor A domain-containing protein 1-like [Pholidichthys leucotaenia]
MDLFFCYVLLWATLQEIAVPATELNCCEGDLLLLLDSSGSVANYEFSRLRAFAAELLRPFSLGRGNVRVGLLQVSTLPNLEFGLDVHTSQESLQKALWSVSQLQGDTNTEAAVGVAQRVLTETQKEIPKILLWLTDGVEPGDVEAPMSELKAQGIYVLIVSLVHGNYQVLRHVATPPLTAHLYSVDIDSIDIITKDLREAIIKIIHADRLRVVELTSHSAELQWRPVLSADSGYYELWHNAIGNIEPDIRQSLPAHSSRVVLTNLQSETTYTAYLRPESNQRLFNTLSVTFTTLPDVLSPAVVSVSDSGPHQIRVSWGPLQSARVQRYTVEYGTFSSGWVHTVTVQSQKNWTVLSGLNPGTQYLITISALHVDGKERAMSVRACTQEAALPALVDLQLASGEAEEVQVEWRANREGLKGYWVNWETKNSQTSSMYLPSAASSTRLPQLPSKSRVCVSPVYSSGRGEGICCTALTHRK